MRIIANRTWDVKFGPCYIIENIIGALPERQLPREYTNGRMYFHSDRDKSILCYEKQAAKYFPTVCFDEDSVYTANRQRITVGNVYTKESFENILGYLKVCSTVLREIQDRQDQQKFCWLINKAEWFEI